MALATAAFAVPCLPPGLEDAMMPAKFQLGDAFSHHAASESAAPFLPLRQCSSQGEWVSAVMATAPFLDATGLHQALRILDRAIANVQEVKGLESIISGLCTVLVAVPGDPAIAQNLASAALMRQHIHEQQQMLLQQLHCLKAAAVEASPSSVGAGEAWAGSHPVVGIEGACLAPSKVIRGSGVGCGPNSEKVPIAAETQKPSRDRVGRPARQAQTLSTSLQVLAHEDPDCLFIVRRINKLGFKACRRLKQHFSAYGPVVRVLVAHSTARQHGDTQCNTRRRPSSLGFVHMASAGAVQEVLLKGLEQEVDGVLIRVQRFERQPEDNMGEDEDEEEHEEKRPEAGEAHQEAWQQPMLAKTDFGRQQSCFSTASTRTAASNAGSFESDGSAACALGAWQD